MRSEKMIMIEIVVDDIVISKRARVITSSGKMVLIKVFSVWKWIESKQSEPSYFYL